MSVSCLWHGDFAFYLSRCRFGGYGVVCSARFLNPRHWWAIADATLKKEKVNVIRIDTFVENAILENFKTVGNWITVQELCIKNVLAHIKFIYQNSYWNFITYLVIRAISYPNIVKIVLFCCSYSSSISYFSVHYSCTILSYNKTP